jgi:hypothetical protein
MDIVLDMTPLYGKVDWPPKTPSPKPRPRFRGRPRHPHRRRRAKKSPLYLAVSQQGRRDRGAAGRYRWACRLWPHAVTNYMLAFAVHANLAAKKPPAAPTGETAAAAMGRFAVRHIESEIAKAHVLSVIELAEAFLATFTPRFSRIDDRPRNQPFHLAVS